MTNHLHDMIRVLRGMSREWQTSKEIVQNIMSSRPALAVLLELEQMGFVERRSPETEENPVSTASWIITKQGEAFLRYIGSRADIREIQRSEADLSEIKSHQLYLVITAPLRVRERLQDYQWNFINTADMLSQIAIQTKEKLCIFAPYVNEVLASILKEASSGINVRFITTMSRNYKGELIRNKAILRASEGRANFQEKYLLRQKFNIQIDQVHAKSIISDGKRAYIGSANLTDTSLFYNLELGVYLEEPGTIKILQALFDEIYEKWAFNFEELLDSEAQ